MTDIDWFEWDRRALPLPVVHVDTGPLAPAEVGDFIFRSTRLFGPHPSFPRLREVATAYLRAIPPGAAIFYNTLL